MIIQNNGEILEKSSDFKSQDFSIKNLSKVFKILIDGIYSDGEGSIMREIVSNAIDANKESGTTKNVEVEFIKKDPLAGLDYTISIKDYGIGLSQERMFDIFCNLGESTKDGDNEYIGGFGIGSKSIFKYTDTYSVKTVSNNIEYLYTLVINEGGLPECNLIYDNPTDSESYTEIIIPIKNNSDFEVFKERAQQQLKWFENITYKGFEIKYPEIIYEGERIIILAKGTGASDIVRTYDYQNHKSIYKYQQEILIGKIPYLFETKSSTNISDCVIKFKVGEIQPTASRESINYNKKSVENFNLIFEEAKKELYNYIKSLVNPDNSEIIKLLSLCKSYTSSSIDINGISSDDYFKTSILSYEKTYWRIRCSISRNTLLNTIHSIKENSLYYYDNDLITEEHVKKYVAGTTSSTYYVLPKSSSSNVYDVLKKVAIPLSSIIKVEPKVRAVREKGNIKYHDITRNIKNNIPFDKFVTEYSNLNRPILLQIDTSITNRTTPFGCINVITSKTNYNKLINLPNFYDYKDIKGYLNHLINNNKDFKHSMIDFFLNKKKIYTGCFTDVDYFSKSIREYVNKYRFSSSLHYIPQTDLKYYYELKKHPKIKNSYNTIINLFKTHHKKLEEIAIKDNCQNITYQLYLKNNKK